MSETTTPQTPSQSCERISLKEIRKELYEQRKTEAQSLWKEFILFSIATTIRAWFYKSLTAIRYHNYFGDIYDFYSDTGSFTKPLDIASCLVAILGLIVTIIWLKKAKKSQAHISIFERRILQIEQTPALEMPTDYRMTTESTYTLTDLPHAKESKFYTGSKGWILLGKVIAILWSIIFSLHAAYTLYRTCEAFVGDSAPFIKKSFILLCVITITITHLLQKRKAKP